MATTPHKVRLHLLEASPWGCALFSARCEAGHIPGAVFGDDSTAWKAQPSFKGVLDKADPH